VGSIEKMSKSKNNGVDPQDMIERYGADTVRLYTMFTAPPDQALEWNDAAVEGCFRFLKRVWHFAGQHEAALRSGPVDPDWGEIPEALRGPRREIHATLKQALADFGREKFNTVVSGGMTIMNVLGRLPDDGPPQVDTLRREGFGLLLRLLSPIVPHITHTLWRRLGFGDDILDAPWPGHDESALVQDTLTLVVQVNGKLRARIEVDADAGRERIEQAALAAENVQRFIEGKPVRKIVVVPGKLVNIVC
ncbi:MAG: class I tRNA ligase family protein, partial [Candidatus Competibacterales bacterium]|nr:class I tRNA ligase family protein [Candidatus Competibacterales bacterium]